MLETVQARLDRNPDKMRVRRQTVEHPFGTIKSWMGSTHFQMKTLHNVSTEMALHVLAYNMKRVMDPSIRLRSWAPGCACQPKHRRFYTAWNQLGRGCLSQ